MGNKEECNYCHGYSNYDSAIDRYTKKGMLSNKEHYEATIEANRLRITQDFSGEERIAIKYCPMCGRKLLSKKRRD